MVKIYLWTAIVAFLLSFVFCIVLIPILKRLKAGQNILVYVKEHKTKSGTPTMGGIAFIAAAILAAVIFIGKTGKGEGKTLLITIAVGVSYMIVGLLDDFLKKRRKENLGLRAWQKFSFQFLIAVFCGIYCLRAGLTRIYLPFTSRSFDFGWWIVPFAVFVFLATVNAVNLTDGLDGLAAGTGAPFLIAVGTLIAIRGGAQGLALVSFSLTGALLAYLCFNVSPASVFMGDTGSLSLGGFAACVAVFSGNALYIAVVGICFVISVISVIMQVIYYKVTRGKRIFLMAPIHHHFQKKGYSEARISYSYSLITAFLGALCVISVL